MYSLFDRPKDWLDVEAVYATRGLALDERYIRHWLGAFVADDDQRFVRLASIFPARSLAPRH